MAASSSSSTPHGDTSSRGYDVFLNHRGDDTKKGLASHIYHRLRNHGLRVFLDQPELEKGEKLTPQIKEAIRTASVHIAIFSPRYADSRWCLDKLLDMVESGSTILPVFYNVRPSDLRWTRDNNGVYGQALYDLEKKTTLDPETNKRKPRHGSDTIEKWRKALTDVSQISGFELSACNGDEGELVDKVVQEVLKKVRRPPLDVAKYPTGLPEKIKDLEATVSETERRLQGQSKKPIIVGIVGIGGVGKTTLATEFFNCKRSIYHRSCFLSDVRSESLPSLQRILLKEFIGSEVEINSVREGKGKLKEYLSSSLKVFMVLDNVDHIDQLEALLSPVKETVHSSSLILVTSRNKDDLKRSDIVDSSIYTLKGLDREHSRELFCQHAFDQPQPVQIFQDVVEKFLDVCSGLPLSLKVIGSLLRGNDDLKYWNERLLQLTKILPNDILSTLKISYDALNKEEQQIFIDIACFFIGDHRDKARRIWDGSRWGGYVGFWKLVNRCLVEVDSENCLGMHDHVRDLGRDLAENPEYPRRIWRVTDDIPHNVSHQSPVVRGISLLDRFDHLKDHWIGGRRRYRLDQQGWRNLVGSYDLSRLQLLRAESYIVEQVFSIGQLPGLIYLHWKNCPKTFLPTSIPLENLRVLHIQGGKLRRLWQHQSQAPLQLRELFVNAPLLELPDSIVKLKNLEELVVDNGHMTSLPDSVGDLTSLQIFKIKTCPQLGTIPNSIGNLTGLKHLELFCCNIPTLPDSVGNLTGLQSLDLSACQNLRTLPGSVGSLEGLQYLNLKWCSRLQKLPDSVGKLTGLQSLDLTDCYDLCTLPGSVGGLTGLRNLNLTNCYSLQELPGSVGSLMGLQSLDLKGCYSLEELPGSVGSLAGLERLCLIRCSGLRKLPGSVGGLTGLRNLNLINCSSLQELPGSVGSLAGLERLGLIRCSGLRKLPGSVRGLTGLQKLNLTNCSSLQELPGSVGGLTGLRNLNLTNCSSLQELPGSVGSLMGLQSLNLKGCSSLEELPGSVGSLIRLQLLNLEACSSLVELPGSLGTLTCLRNLSLTKCSKLEELPDSVGSLMGLQSLHLKGCSRLQKLPSSVGSLTDLQRLNLSDCSSLETLPATVGELTGLECLDLSGCSSVRTLPDSVGHLTGLKFLWLPGCSNLETLPNIENLRSLDEVNVGGCPNLQLGEEVVEQLHQRHALVDHDVYFSDESEEEFWESSDEDCEEELSET